MREGSNIRGCVYMFVKRFLKQNEMHRKEMGMLY